MREKEIHGMADTTVYRVWAQMIQRCTNPKQKAFENYGAKGIKVCSRWKTSFAAFLEDMGPRPTPAHSIERENNVGNYEPGNCHWATRDAQSRNTSRNRMVTIDDRDQLVTDVAVANGIPAATARMRLHLGWSPLRAATHPLKRCGPLARARL